MAGRFPFDPSRGNGQQQFNAQMRAALGLPAIDANEALYLQAQQAAQAQRQQNEQLLQRDFHIRQALLQDQIDRHLSLERLRGIPFLEENRDLMDYKTELELRDLEEQRQLEEQRLTEQEYLRQQVAVAQLRYQDEVRRQQQNFRQEELAQHAHAIAQAQAQAQAAQVQKAVQERAQAAKAAQVRASAQMAAQEHLATQELTNAKVRAQEFATAKQKPAKTKPMLKGQAAAKKHAGKLHGGVLPQSMLQTKTSVKASKSPPKSKSAARIAKGKKKGEAPMKRSAATPTKRAATAKTKAALKAAGKGRKVPLKAKGAASKRGSQKSALNAAAIASGVKFSREIICKGTLEGLLAAATEDEKLDDAAKALNAFKAEVEWTDSEDEEEKDPDGLGLPGVPLVPAETIAVGRFTSILPALPEEPEMELVSPSGEVITGKDDAYVTSLLPDNLGASRYSPKSKLESTPAKASKNGKSFDQKSKKGSSILDYPFPVDTWWPSTSAVRAERRANGETSDEDNFEDPPHRADVPARFRANEKKIRKLLAHEVEPGYLEKLNHCRIHRIRTRRKKNSNTPELVYCFQVTELYPNDMMVCCSMCGTWRHAACGGHYKPYSTRENCKEPFIALCENCHEEKPYLEEFPKGAQRLDRQRMEHIRRALATSAVMRHASYSKHNGTYKWPLGSVSATHISGHTRSVQARHDKAERQWADMSARLTRSDGLRPKDRVRVRTKELERLLVSIEDAESYTDRHNMMLFLMRDTAREVPIGFERQPKNLFDPDEPDVLPAHMQQLQQSTATAEGSPSTPVATATGKEPVNPCNGDSHRMVDANEGAMEVVDEPEEDDGHASGSDSSMKEDAKLPASNPPAKESDNHDRSEDEDDQEAEEEEDKFENAETSGVANANPDDDNNENDHICLRPRCTKRRRFDSRFCSDGCGVLALEMDLLRSLQDASEIHPSVLRLT